MSPGTLLLFLLLRPRPTVPGVQEMLNKYLMNKSLQPCCTVGPILPSYTDKPTKVQRGEVTCPRSHKHMVLSSQRSLPFPQTDQGMNSGSALPDPLFTRLGKCVPSQTRPPHPYLNRRTK